MRNFEGRWFLHSVDSPVVSVPYCVLAKPEALPFRQGTAGQAGSQNLNQKCRDSFPFRLEYFCEQKAAAPSIPRTVRQRKESEWRGRHASKASGLALHTAQAA
jgi:hypothetical protein